MSGWAYWSLWDTWTQAGWGWNKAWDSVHIPSFECLQHMQQHCNRPSPWAWCFLLHGASYSAILNFLYVSRGLVSQMVSCLCEICCLLFNPHFFSLHKSITSKWTKWKNNWEATMNLEVSCETHPWRCACGCEQVQEHAVSNHRG